MKIIAPIFGILLFLMAGSANVRAQSQSDRVIGIVNEHKKAMSGKVLLKNDRDMNVLLQLPVHGRTFYFEDSIEAAASIRKTPRRIRYSDEMVYRRALGLQGVVDVDLKVFRIKAKTFKDALSKIPLDVGPSFIKVMKDTGYTDIGCAVTQGRGYVSVLIGISKRYVDFIPGTRFLSSEAGIHAITVSGHSRLNELYYDADMDIPESGGLYKVKPVSRKKIELDKNGNFTITVPTFIRKGRRWKMLGYFDKDDNLVAYNPLYGFGKTNPDSAR